MILISAKWLLKFEEPCFKTDCFSSTATSFGDPHFVTFDGADYTFNGKGEFTMVVEEESGFELQVRTEQAKCSGASCDIHNERKYHFKNTMSIRSGHNGFNFKLAMVKMYST